MTQPFRCVSLVLSLAVFLAAGGVFGGRALANPPLKTLLAHQGFPLSLDAGASLENRGRIQGGRIVYIVYYYYHINPVTQHGIQAIVLVTGRGKYIGYYEMDGDPPTSVTGRDIVYNEPKSEGNRIRIGPAGPPKTVVIGDRRYNFWSAADSLCLASPSCPKERVLRRH
jgi:hypothetical protein